MTSGWRLRSSFSKTNALAHQAVMIAVLERLARRNGMRDVAHFLRMAATEAARMADETVVKPVHRQVNEIVALLRQKQELDLRNDEALGMASYDRWMAEALAALLRLAEEEKARQRPSERVGGA
jgi:hypothetical protein